MSSVARLLLQFARDAWTAFGSDAASQPGALQYRTGVGLPRADADAVVALIRQARSRRNAAAGETGAVSPAPVVPV
jgi:hypothetical protein